MGIFNVKITKAGDHTESINTDDLPEDMYKQVIQAGLEVILNSRMAKVGAITKLEGAELEKAHDAAKKIAAENKEKLLKGELKAKGKKAKSAIPTALKAEARRMARAVVRDVLKANGEKLGKYPASVITKYADELITSDPSYLDKARANLEASTEEAKGKAGSINLAALLADPAKKASAPKADKPLSAKQAGMVAPRSRPAHEVQNLH